MIDSAAPIDNTLKAMLSAGAQRLAQQGKDQPARDVRLLAAAALNKSPDELYFRGEEAVSAAAAAAFWGFIDRRANGEPVSRILGQRGFWTLDLKVSPAVLDPRADSECLIETALDLVPGKDEAVRVLDLGTGSGCLLLSLLDEWPLATGIGLDLSPDALTLARENAIACGMAGRVRFVCGNWTDALAGEFDLIISNPPYIATEEIGRLEPEVARHDPRLALDGGQDGLAAYKAFIPDLVRLLRPGGTMIVEIGADQATAVKSLIEHSKTRNVTVSQDLSGRNRCISAKKSLECEQ